MTSCATRQNCVLVPTAKERVIIGGTVWVGIKKLFVEPLLVYLRPSNDAVMAQFTAAMQRAEYRV